MFTETYGAADSRHYWHAVRSIALDALDEAREEVGPDAEAGYAVDRAGELAWEAVDGSYWVYIAPRARLVLSYSEHPDAWEELGTLADLAAGASSLSDIDVRAAFYAMAADVAAVLAILEREDEEGLADFRAKLREDSKALAE